MLNRRQTLRNAVLTAGQVVVSAVFLFAVYRYLLVKLGPAQLGVWSIVMAISTVARISDLGFAGGMTRFVAKYRANEQPEAVIEVIETGAISLFAICALVLSLVFPLLLHFSAYIFRHDGLSDALLLLPYSLISFGFLALAGVFLSSLDGLQRSDLKSLILIFSTLVQAVLIFALVGRLGMQGLGLAQVIQSLLVLVVGWVVLKRQIPGLALLPRRWARARFREMLSYNLNLQFSSVAAFFGDPLAKILIGQYGSLAMVGFYEMAGKLVAQFRSIVVNVNQVLVPVIARAFERDKNAVGILYESTYFILFAVSVTFYCGVAVVLPLVSMLWLGHYDIFFVDVGYVLVLAMAFNTLTGPAYFSNLGSGSVGANSWSQFILGVVNVVLGVSLGRAFGGMGAVVAYALAVLIGSGYLFHVFSRSQGLSWRTLLPDGMGGFAGVTVFLAVISAVLGRFLDYSAGVSVAFGLTVVQLFALLCLFIFSPARVRMQEMVRSRNG